MDYPIWDVTIGAGMMIGIVAISHVIVSHFAVGGGLLLAVTETLAVRRGDASLRDLVRRASFVLVLISTVFGAISGVGIWVVVGLAAPGAISALIHNYVWGWAMEWVSFIVEIVAALVYYTTWGKVSKRVHLMVAWVYFVAAYMSLVIINGIITFMLTPGDWLKTHDFWDGFFNPTYWPALLLRTGIVLMMAVAIMAFSAIPSGEDRPRHMRYLGLWMVAGILLSYAGYRWWEAALPEPVRALFLGENPALAALADTRGFLLWSLAAALALALVVLVAVPKLARWPTVAAVALCAFAFFGGYERLREGVRKPFLIHDYMFSNGLRVADLPAVRDEGALKRVWGVTDEMDDVEKGRLLFNAQCRVCHTLDGYLSIRALLPDDPDMIYSVAYALYDQGEAYVGLEAGATIDKAALDYPFMPPFAGSEDEIDILTAYLTTLTPSASVSSAGGQP